MKNVKANKKWVNKPNNIQYVKLPFTLFAMGMFLALSVEIHAFSCKMPAEGSYIAKWRKSWSNIIKKKSFFR